MSNFNNIKKKYIKLKFIKAKLASEKKILSWSSGVVKIPDTINYNTLKPQISGLFCPIIFGYNKKYECYCGNYIGKKYNNIICKICKVKVTNGERRKKMGHINLNIYITHTWFFKTLPSFISLILNISYKNLESIIYFKKYLIIDKGNSKYKNFQVISINQYKKKKLKYNFKVDIGSKIIYKLLKKINIKKELKKIKFYLKKTNSESIYKKNLKRLEIFKYMKKSKIKPKWMVFRKLPVIPGDLRPLVLLENGSYASSDINDLLREIIIRNNRLKIILNKKELPDNIKFNEQRMLQESVDSLLDNKNEKNLNKKEKLKSFSDIIKGKTGRFRQNLLGKRVDYSARTVIIVEPKLKLNQCGIPKSIALVLYKPFLLNKLINSNIVKNIKEAKIIYKKKKKIIWEILNIIIKNHPIFLNRAPTLHRLSIQAFEIILIKEKAIKIHPLICTAFNADFDGDQMAIHIPLSIKSQIESYILMLSVNNILHSSNGDATIVPTQDIILGLYYGTCILNNDIKKKFYYNDLNEAIIAYKNNEIIIYALKYF
ncbi:putative DNA-directed RNA polymerase subunit beta' N terminal domain (rpoC1) [Candidatus Zinderia insecticola CARI]|uniref:DNA-directed RNA polymerase subunit n=1 Tax=Zinderia insecticola (strain CARI) TaxID=871271 RepID=E0TIP7_ZINIC|nr:putative DNA-directed RNA polymerase subunit beta' N terminal domain (rpoC1) [Candidatus Zinderia insecticola CARI]